MGSNVSPRGGPAMFPTHRPRRLRTTPAMRRLVAETDLRPRQLVLPMFVREGIDEPVPVGSMPGVVQHTRETLRKAATEAVGRGRRRPDALRRARPSATPPAARASTRTASSTRRCATCGPRSATPSSSWPTSASTSSPTTATAACSTRDGGVDNDATLAVYAEMAVAQAEAGAHMVGPSGMMDGQVGVIRQALDARGPPGRRRARPTPSSTRRRSTARSARPSTRSCAATARPTSRTRRTSARRCASSRSTSRRAPTS